MDPAGHRARRTTLGPPFGAAPVPEGLHGLPAAGQRGHHREQGAAGRLAARPHEPVDVDRHAFRQLLDRELHAEVVRDRVETAAVH
jgi:hypothetical protein